MYAIDEMRFCRIVMYTILSKEGDGWWVVRGISRQEVALLLVDIAGSPSFAVRNGFKPRGRRPILLRPKGEVGHDGHDMVYIDAVSIHKAI